MIIAVLLLMLVIIINMVRRRTLELKYVLAWLLADILLILFTVFPSIMMGIARFMGIYSPVNMIFFLGFIFLAAIAFSMTVALSRLSASQRRLAQESALWEYEKESGRADTASAGAQTAAAEPMAAAPEDHPGKNAEDHPDQDGGKQDD